MTSNLQHAFATSALSLALLAFALPSASASPTMSFVVDRADGFSKGELVGAAVMSDGRVVRGARTDRVALDQASVTHCAVEGSDGAVYVGTGNPGTILRVSGSTVKKFADAAAAGVTSLLPMPDGLYAGTLATGSVLRIGTDGATKATIKLERAQHVWSLAYDSATKTLYAGTGPQGLLYTIDAQGKARVLYDAEAEHVMSLAMGKDGTLYAGLSSGARVMRIQKGKADVLYDLPGAEATALAVGPDFVVVAANEFETQPITPAPSESAVDTAARLKRPKPGKGKLFVIYADGRVELLASDDSTQFTSVAVEPGAAAVLVGSGQDGKLLRAALSGETAQWADVAERQVSALALTAKQPFFVTSDGAALYRLGATAERGTWLSATLDSNFNARFGALDWLATGDVRLSTRSGQTDKPDATWSDWSRALDRPGPITSPSARFLQLRAELGTDAELRAVRAYYLPRNQPPRVSDVRLKQAKKDKDDVKDATTVAPLSAARTSTVDLQWTIDNSDGDTLRYYVYQQRDGQSAWLALLPEYEVLEKTEYAWKTDAVPDGYYRIRVVATDETSTSQALALTRAAVSAPLLVDNHAPSVQLAVDGSGVRGVARDDVSPIASAAYALDGGPWKTLVPEDGLFDTRDERFFIDPKWLPPGTHVVAVRVLDSNANIASGQLQLRTK